MWKIELTQQQNPEAKKLRTTTIGSKEDWYKGSLEYWNDQPATVDGVLGGYGDVHDQDSVTSAEMLQEFKEQISGWRTAIDLGAGIGRISKTTLLPRFAEVDLVEPAEI
jgi:protein N-terminal methyltransferase